jgi:cysteine desulfurase / selenocysteine lyase
MDVRSILQDEALRQTEFPVARHRVFLAHAGVSPLPRRVADAITHYTAASTADDQEAAIPEKFLPETRQLAAELLGATPDEVAFVGPTSLALSYVAAGLPFRRHDNVLVYLDDYPSNVYPWMALSDRGVEVRFLRAREPGCLRVAEVLGAADENTRLVTLASAHFLTGFRPDLAAIGRGLRQRGIWFCVDAIQTLGAFPLPLEDVDFLAADAHKWMLGPCAAGILYVRREMQSHLRPIALGWHNVRCPNFVAQEDLVFRTDARRYEAGSHNLVGLAGLRAALELIRLVGVDPISAELLRKRQRLLPALQSKGYTVLGASAPAERSTGIVTFHREGVSMADLHAKLTDAHVTTSLRSDRAGRQYLRWSPHFYNTDDELDRALALV